MSRFTTSSSAYGAFYAQGYQALPPRRHVPDPQQALLGALASPIKSAPTQGDGLMLAKAKRQAPPQDARANQASEPSAEGSSLPVVVFGRLVPQPGDGSCLFHSLGHYFGASAAELRSEAASTIEANPALEISGTPLHKWIEWDENLSPPSYAARLRSGSWGGALELAVISAMMGVVIHVYEPVQADQYRRIATFGSVDDNAFTAVAHIAFRGRCHYDALLVAGPKL